MHRLYWTESLVGLAAVAGAAHPLAGQKRASPPPTPAALTAAAATITAAAVAQHLQVLAADSMRKRDTPSSDLERAAQYVADQFQQLGLQEYENGWQPARNQARQPSRAVVQHYPVPGQLQLDYAQSGVAFAAALIRRGRPVVTEAGWPAVQYASARFATTARFADSVGPPVIAQKVLWDLSGEDARAGSNRVVLVTGRHTATSVASVALGDHVVLYVPSKGEEPAVRRAVLAQLYRASRGVVIVSEVDSASFAAALRSMSPTPVQVVDAFLLRQKPSRGGWPWAVEVQPGAIRGVLAAAGVDLVEVGVDTMPRVRELPSLAVRLDPNVDTVHTTEPKTAPLVVGMVEGTDPSLQQTCLVITAHLDTHGIGPGQTGRPDGRVAADASGVAGLLVLARAFTQPGARPRRSIIFLATSGSQMGQDFWGSRFFLRRHARGKPEIVANVTLDMLGHPTTDSVTIDGMDDIEPTVRPDWLAATHPELRLTVVNGGTAARPQADHFPFVQYAVPSLYFHNGIHGAADAVVESRGAFDAELEVRVLRLAFYVGQQIANTDERLRWTTEAREQWQRLEEP